MRKKLVPALCSILVGTAVLMSACGMKEAGSTEPAPTPVPTEAPATPTPVPTKAPLKTLGTKEEGAYHVQIKNMISSEITGVAVKTIEEAEYGENLLKENDIIALKEERDFYYKPAETPEEEQPEGEKLLTPGYDIQLTLGNDMVLELHAFPFEDMEKCELYAADGVVYITYDSITTKEPVNTKEAELAILQQAAEEAAAAEAAAAEAQAQPEETYDQGYTEPDYTYDGGYSDPGYGYDGGYTDPGYGYDGGYSDPGYGYDGGYTDPGYGSGGDSCLDDGLVY